MKAVSNAGIIMETKWSKFDWCMFEHQANHNVCIIYDGDNVSHFSGTVKIQAPITARQVNPDLLVCLKSLGRILQSENVLWLKSLSDYGYVWCTCDIAWEILRLKSAPCTT